MYHLIADSFHVAGPFGVLDAEFAHYVDYRPIKDHIYSLGAVRPDRFYSRLSPAGWTHVSNRMVKLDELQAALRNVFRAMQSIAIDRRLVPWTGQQSTILPSPLERALAYFAQAMFDGLLEDPLIRPNAAIETLFPPPTQDEKIGKNFKAQSRAQVSPALHLRTESGYAATNQDFIDLCRWRNDILHCRHLAMTRYGTETGKGMMIFWLLPGKGSRCLGSFCESFSPRMILSSYIRSQQQHKRCEVRFLLGFVPKVHLLKATR